MDRNVQLDLSSPSLPLPEAPRPQTCIPCHSKDLRSVPPLLLSGTPDFAPSEASKSRSPSTFTSPPFRRHPETGLLWKGEAKVTSPSANPDSPHSCGGGGPRWTPTRKGAPRRLLIGGNTHGQFWEPSGPG